MVPIEETPDELDVGGVLEQASSAFTAQPAVVKKLPPGAVRLMPGVSADETVMVTGADGLIGRLVVAELLERCPGAKVRACGTSLSALEERLADLVKAPSLELIQWDALVDPFTEAFDGVSAVVWCASSFGRPSTGVPKEEEKEEEADMPQLVKKVGHVHQHFHCRSLAYLSMNLPRPSLVSQHISPVPIVSHHPSPYSTSRNPFPCLNHRLSASSDRSLSSQTLVWKAAACVVQPMPSKHPRHSLRTMRRGSHRNSCSCRRQQ